MGRISQFSLALALGFSAWACGGAAKEETKPESKPAEAQTEAQAQSAAGEPAQLDVTPAATPEAEPEGVPEAKDALHPIVRMTTSLGDIYLELDAEKAPISTVNFIQYAKDGFYKGTIFHRVIPNFMIQGGGYTPDMVEKSEGIRPPIKNESSNGLKNVRGAISMARLPDPDSATAQFFINVVDNPNLDAGSYAVFGRVVKGMDVVDKIKTTKLIQHPKYPAPEAVTPETPVVIENVEVISQFDQAALEANLAEKQAEAKAAGSAAVDELAKKIETETGKPLATTASGLKYVHVAEGQGTSPTENDTILADFAISLGDGTVLSSTRQEGGEPQQLPIARLLPGWKEAMLLMKPGGKIKAIIPAELAFGEKGAPNRGVPPYAPLVLDLELKEVKNVENDMKVAIEKVEKETGKKVERTESGLGYVVMIEGTGATPAATDTVKVHYTGVLVDGTKFDSSVDRGEPATFGLSQVIRGWTEGVGLMKVGEKRKLIIPPALGYGDQAVGGVIPPNSVLIFDVELLEIVK